MSAKYQKLMAWGFNRAYFSQAIASWLKEFSRGELAEIVGVHPTTIDHWSRNQFNDHFSYPSMTNLLIVCNELDLNPTEMFILEDA